MHIALWVSILFLPHVQPCRLERGLIHMHLATPTVEFFNPIVFSFLFFSLIFKNRTEPKHV